MEDRVSKKRNNTTEYSDSEVLRFLMQNDTIDIEEVANSMNKSKLKEVLKNHKATIAQHRDGRYRTYVKQENGKRKLLVAATEEKLYEALLKHYESMSKKQDADLLTVEALYPAWLNMMGLHGASSTYLKRIDADWRNHYVGNTIIKIPLAQINKQKMDIWAHTLIKKLQGKKKQYYNISLIMRGILDYAVDAGMIPQNPLRQVKINARMVFTPERKKASETQVFTKEEVKLLYEMAWKDFNEGHNRIHKLAPLAVMFQFQTALRIGELCTIDVDDVYGKELYVQRMYRHEEKEIVDYLKGHNEGRYVPLTPTALRLIDEAKRFKIQNGISTKGYIFSVNDEPLSYYSVRKLYYRYCEMIDTCVKSSHKSRKTVVSAMLEGGVAVDTVREIVGHKEVSTTYNSYCYDRKTDMERVELITQALS